MKRELCLLLPFVGLLLLSACNIHTEKDTTSASAYFNGTVGPEINQPVLEEKVRGFFDWYTTRIDSLVDIQLVDNSGVEDTGLYAINFDSTEAYLRIVAESGIFTSDYIGDKRAYFRLCHEKMRRDSVRSTTPYGLDADLILLSQEYEEDITNFSQVTFSNYTETENGASIDVTIIYTLRMDFVIQGDRILLDKIDIVPPEGGDE